MQRWAGLSRGEGGFFEEAGTHSCDAWIGCEKAEKWQDGHVWGEQQAQSTEKSDARRFNGWRERCIGTGSPHSIFKGAFGADKDLTLFCPGLMDGTSNLHSLSQAVLWHPSCSTYRKGPWVWQCLLRFLKHEIATLKSLNCFLSLRLKFAFIIVEECLILHGNHLRVSNGNFHVSKILNLLSDPGPFAINATTRMSQDYWVAWCWVPHPSIRTERVDLCQHQKLWSDPVLISLHHENLASISVLLFPSDMAIPATFL